MTGNLKLLRNFVEKFIGIVRFGKNNFAAITEYGDYVQDNLTICHVYYVEGLGHNLFSVRQFCDGNLEVAFRSNTCYVRNLEGEDSLTGSRDSNLYTISISEITVSSPVCLISKATSTKSWLWHRRFSHLNFGTINQLSKNELVDGLSRFKYDKDHLCSACEQRKSKNATFSSKLVLSTNSKLELLHMDLCRPMRVETANECLLDGDLAIMGDGENPAKEKGVLSFDDSDDTDAFIKHMGLQAPSFVPSDANVSTYNMGFSGQRSKNSAIVQRNLNKMKQKKGQWIQTDVPSTVFQFRCSLASLWALGLFLNFCLHKIITSFKSFNLDSQLALHCTPFLTAQQNYSFWKLTSINGFDVFFTMESVCYGLVNFRFVRPWYTDNHMILRNQSANFSNGFDNSLPASRLL
ncbi:integrase, catalytic region, zinc finger, CCHC-type containing protein [Tanacetum coccineum]